jgi:hypothetical protein
MKAFGAGLPAPNWVRYVIDRKKSATPLFRYSVFNRE